MDLRNRRCRSFYDLYAWIYDASQRLLCRRHAGETAVRTELLNQLSISPGARILEVSIGTGANLRFLPQGRTIIGVDLSMGMLRRCRTRLQRYGQGASLCQALGEYLPFRDDVFDVAFHVGGINLFADRHRGVREMIRVVKPGGVVVICDERVTKLNCIERRLCSWVFGRLRLGDFQPPVAAIPVDLREVRVDYPCSGAAYRIWLRKPG